MIIAIRRGFKKNATNIILWVMLISMGWFWIPGLLNHGDSGEQWVASINKQKIYRPTFDQRVGEENERLNLLKRRFGKFTKEFLEMQGISTNPRELALNSLLKETLLDQVANKLDIKIESEYLVQKFNDPLFLITEFGDMIPHFVIDNRGNINVAAFIDYLQSAGKLESFEHFATEKIKRKIVEDVASGTLYVSDFEIKNRYISNYLDKKFSILIFNLDKFISKVKKEPIDEKDLKSFFNKENQKSKKYWIPESRNGIEYIFSSKDYGVKISDKKIEKYYDKFKMKFQDSPPKVKIRKMLLNITEDNKIEEVRKKADEILKQIKENPSNFAELAKKYSEDKESANKGGLIDFFARGSYDKALEKASFSLKDDGDISPIIKTGSGLEIIQLVDKKARSFKSLDSVKDQIKETLLSQRFSKMFINDVKNISDEGEAVSVQLLLKLVKDKDAKEEIVKDMVKGDSLISKRTFRLRDIGDFEFFIDNGKGIIVKLTKINKSYLPNIDTVREMVISDCNKEKATKMLKKQMKEVQELSKEESFDKLAKEFDLKLKKTDFINNQDTKEIKKLIEDGIPAEYLLGIVQEGHILDYFDGQDGFLSKIEAIKEFSEKDFEVKKDIIRKELYRDQAILFEGGIISSLYRDADVKFEKSFKVGS